MAQLRKLGKKIWEAYGIDPRKITVRPGFNCRDFSNPKVLAHIAWLKTSIAERGVDEPIWIENTGEKIFLIDGECRLRALCELWNEGKKIFVPTISYKGDEAAVLAKSLATNNGLALTVLEIGKAADRLFAYGWTDNQVADLLAPHLGYSPKKAKRHIDDAVELHHAPLEVKEQVSKGVDGVKISPALAVQKVRENRETAPKKIREAAVKAKSAGKTEAKREKAAGPATIKRTDEQSAMKAAEKLAEAVDLWIEDATEPAEKALIAAHGAYRKIVARKLL
jgi:hypothetical protein